MTKINWKHLATTPGYKSLKAAYVADVEKDAKSTRSMRDKAEFLKLFREVIGRAKHYAHYTGKAVFEVLNEWEDERTYWWLNFYRNHIPKLHKKVLKPRAISGIRLYYKGCGYTPITRKHMVCHAIIKMQQAASTKIKPRWDASQKASHKRYKRSL